MTPAAIIRHAQAEGVTLAMSPAGTIKAIGNGEAVNRWLPLIREHKTELLDELRAANDGAHEPPPDPVVGARRRRVLAMLAERPDIRYALITDDRADREAVILALATRGVMQDGSIVTCELRIPRAKYDPFLLLDLIERHGGTVH